MYLKAKVRLNIRPLKEVIKEKRNEKYIEGQKFIYDDYSSLKIKLTLDYSFGDSFSRKFTEFVSVLDKFERDLELCGKNIDCFLIKYKKLLKNDLAIECFYNKIKKAYEEENDEELKGYLLRIQTALRKLIEVVKENELKEDFGPIKTESETNKEENVKEEINEEETKTEEETTTTEESEIEEEPVKENSKVEEFQKRLNEINEKEDKIIKEMDDIIEEAYNNYEEAKKQSEPFSKDFILNEEVLKKLLQHNFRLNKNLTKKLLKEGTIEFKTKDYKNNFTLKSDGILIVSATEEKTGELKMIIYQITKEGKILREN